jgi:hypothetical protein
MSKSNLPAAISSTSELPAHLQMGVSVGNENVTADDISVPRIKLIQKMSPEVDEGSAKYIPDIKPGQLLNTVTNKASDSLLLINMFFESGYSVFKQRDLGGGLYGNFKTEQEAKQALNDEGLTISDYDIASTHTHTMLLLDENTGDIEMPAIMDFQSTKLRVSREWNTDIKTRCAGTAPRYGAVYRLKGKIQTNAKGQSWHNLEFKFEGWANEKLLAEAKENFEGMHAHKAASAENEAA